MNEIRRCLYCCKECESFKKFYQDLFDLEIFQDYGINVSFGGLSLQQEFDWLTGVPKESILEKPTIWSCILKKMILTAL